jgi:hypothetical protein
MVKVDIAAPLAAALQHGKTRRAHDPPTMGRVNEMASLGAAALAPTRMKGKIHERSQADRRDEYTGLVRRPRGRRAAIVSSGLGQSSGCAGNFGNTGGSCNPCGSRSGRRGCSSDFGNARRTSRSGSIGVFGQQRRSGRNCDGSEEKAQAALKEFGGRALVRPRFTERGSRADGNGGTLTYGCSSPWA